MNTNSRNGYLIAGVLFIISAIFNSINQTRIVIPILLVLAGILMFAAAWQQNRKRVPAHCDSEKSKPTASPLKTGLVLIFAIATAGLLGYSLGYGLVQIF